MEQYEDLQLQRQNLLYALIHTDLKEKETEAKRLLKEIEDEMLKLFTSNSQNDGRQSTRASGARALH
jgi:hypothetical protein